MNRSRSPIPASFFGIAVGVLALANAWRVAVRLWQLPAELAQVFALAGVAVWLLMVGLYAQKWLLQREAALAELQHPVQASFVALIPVSTLLAATTLLPVSRALAEGLFALALAAQLALGLWLHGRFWQGGRKAELITPAVYLPAVAQNFVAATAAASFGWSQVGMWFFGAGLLSWLAIESMLLNRAALLDATLLTLRPALGIQLAPPVAGGVSYLALNGGVPDLFAQALLGYGLYQALMLVRLLPWIRQPAFTPSYWAFSFGVAALPTLAMRLVEGGASGVIGWLAPVLFAVANLVIGGLALRTLGLLFSGHLLPAPVAVSAS